MDLVAEKRAHITPEPPARKRKRKTPPTVTPPEPLVPATSTSPAPPPPFQPTQSAQPFRSAAPPPPQPEPIQPEPTPTAESPPTVPPPADLPRTSPAEPLPQQHQHDDGIHEWILLALAEAGLDVGKAGDSMPLPERLKPLAGRKFVGRAKVAPVSTLPPDKVVDARKSLTTDEWRRCIAFAEEFGLTQRSGGRLFASATRQPMLGVLGVLASNAGRMQGVASYGICLPHVALVMCAHVGIPPIKTGMDLFSYRPRPSTFPKGGWAPPRLGALPRPQFSATALMVRPIRARSAVENAPVHSTTKPDSLLTDCSCSYCDRRGLGSARAPLACRGPRRRRSSWSPSRG